MFEELTLSEYRKQIKFKYRDPRNVPVTKNGTYKARANAARGANSKQGKGIRRRSYYTHIVY